MLMLGREASVPLDLTMETLPVGEEEVSEDYAAGLRQCMQDAHVRAQAHLHKDRKSVV